MNTQFLLFLDVSWALILSPGPDMLYVISRGIAHGRRAGVLSAIGVVSGILVHTTAAAFRLTLILQTSAFAFLLVKYVGAAYLIYLGIKAWLDKSTLSIAANTPVVTSSAVFWQGVLSNILNPSVHNPDGALSLGFACDALPRRSPWSSLWHSPSPDRHLGLGRLPLGTADMKGEGSIPYQ